MEVCGNVDQACRLCLHGEGRISVFEDENTKLSVTSESIYKCVSVKITKEDRLPKSICENCLSNVKNWCSFKNTCDKTQETLNGWLTCDRLNTHFKEEEISILKDSLPNRTAASLFDHGNDSSFLPAPSAFLGNNVDDVGTVPCKRVEEMPPEVERNASEDGPEEISSTILTEEENRQSSIVSSTKEIADTSCSAGITEQNGTFCSPVNCCSQIENVESQQVSENLSTESEVALSNDLKDNVQNGGVSNSVEPMEVSNSVEPMEVSNSIEPMEVSNSIEPTEVSSNIENETNLAPEKLPSCNSNDSSSIIHSSVEVLEANLVDSSELVNVKESSENVISDEIKNDSMGVVNLNSQNELESVKELETSTCLDVRLNEASQSIKDVTNVSCEFIDSTDTSKEDLNVVTSNKLKEDEILPDTTILPASKAVEVPKNESSPDSDKENATPNSAALSTDNSKEKQAKIAESGEQSGEGENQSFSEIRIESISTLTFESSDFFNAQDGKPNSDQSAASGCVGKSTGSGINENSVSRPADKPQSIKESINVEEPQKEKEVALEEQNNTPITGQNTVMEVDRTEGDGAQEHPERAILVESEQGTPPFSQLMIQNIKQEPIDTHETASSGNNSNLYPIRVKSEFASLEYDDDVTNDYLENQPSISGEETNKCDICNRKYSSLSNYLKHLQTKVHIYNASVCPRENNLQSPDATRTPKYLGDSRLNYSNDSYSEDSRLSNYANDSPMLRSRLCSEEFVQPSPSKLQHFIARQAQPRVPYAPSLSKLPKRKERCKLCNTSFTYISEMRRHLLSKKHKDNERMMRDNERMMRENERLIRDSERMFREKERFLRERALMSPKKEEVPAPQSDKNQLPYICPIEDCHYSCQKGNRLLAHMRTHGIGQPSAPPTPQVVKEVDSPTTKPKLSLRQQELLKKELEKRRASTAVENVPTQPLVHDFKCEGCGKAFLRESGLKKHSYYCSAIIAEQQEEIEEQPKFPDNNIDNLQIKKMHCPICNLTFAAKSVFISHVQIYHKGSTLESGLFRPKKTIITSNKLRIKSKKGHGYVCNHCGKKFNLLSSLNFHLKVHSTKHICKICKKGYDSRRAFMDHCRLHFLPPGSKQTLCHKCFRVFKTRGEFHFHRKNDLCSIKLKIYTCNICQHSFKDPSALEEHKAKFHTDVLDVSDDETPSVDHGAPLQNYLSMNRHNLETGNENRPGTSSKLHSNINQPTNQANSEPILHCDVCDRDYATIASLKKHMWKYHQTRPVITRRLEARRNNILQANISKCWKCKHCKRVFATRRMLVVHLKKCKYNALEPEAGMCLQCGKWCESGKSRICRFCLPDLNKIQKAKRSLPESNFLMTPKAEFSMAPKQEFSSAPGRVSNHNLQVPKAKVTQNSGIRLMKCPVGNKYFRSELLMIKHYSQCDGSCENRCSHCRKLFNSPKEYRTHLLNSNCYGSNRFRAKISNLSRRSMGNYSETEFQESDMHPVGNNDELDTSGELSVLDSSISEENSIMDLDTGLENDPSNKVIEEKSIKMGRVCTLCNKVITMQRGVYRHVYGCFKQCMLSQESVSCKKCNRTFSKHLTMKENTSAIRQHILDCHYIPYYEGEGVMEDGSRTEVPPPLLCYVCSFGFSTNEGLKRHIMEHRSRKDEINNVVLLLEAEILSERRLNSENITYHIEIQPEICKTVSSQPVRKRNVLSFKAPGSVGIGSRKIIRKKLLECEKCNRKFTNRNKFFRHKKVHGIVTQSVFHEVSENYLNFIADHTPPSNN